MTYDGWKKIDGININQTVKITMLLSVLARSHVPFAAVAIKCPSRVFEPILTIRGCKFPPFHSVTRPLTVMRNLPCQRTSVLLTPIFISMRNYTSLHSSTNNGGRLTIKRTPIYQQKRQDANVALLMSGIAFVVVYHYPEFVIIGLLLLIAVPLVYMFVETVTEKIDERDERRAKNRDKREYDRLFAARLAKAERRTFEKSCGCVIEQYYEDTLMIDRRQKKFCRHHSPYTHTINQLFRAL